MVMLLTLLAIANLALVAWAITSVLRRHAEPMSNLAWIFSILLFPGLGVLFYVLVGSNSVVRRISRKRRRLAQFVARMADWKSRELEATDATVLPSFTPQMKEVEQIGRRLAQMPAVGGNEVRVYEEANATYAALEDAIRRARHHIHMEYYIWQPDETGVHFRDLLAQRARDGVECRVLLDAVGCLKLGRSFLQPWYDAGVRVAFFLPIWKLRKRWSPHLRNHRKIVVVDGQEGFTGSQNIGDEYRGRLKKLSPWFDSHIWLSGPAVLFLQQTFAEDWSFSCGEQLDLATYFAPPAVPGKCVLQVLPTGPDQTISPLEQLIFAAVTSAREVLRIATPYFVPDLAIRTALMHAATRNVRVQLVLPTRSDSPLVLWAGRSFYRELLQAGVEIYEYDGGVLHSKYITVDDRWCMLGSANMDVRSFRLNFEITAVIYDEGVVKGLAESVQRYCDRSRQITLRDVYSRRMHQDLLAGAARLFSPLL